MSDSPAPAIRPAGPQARAVIMYHMWCENVRGMGLDPNLYVLLDAARDRLIYSGLQRFARADDITCLYQGSSAEELAHVAPYLLRLGPRTDVFDWLWDNGWGRSWGIFLWSTETLEGLRAHFRRLTKVRTEDGQVLLFRFYDPRVLSIFLPTCFPEQITKMFGPVTRFIVEACDGVAITEYSNVGGVLRRRLLSLQNNERERQLAEPPKFGGSLEAAGDPRPRLAST
jgi:hypothetical protein